jgi:hypothetical protein
MKKIKIILAHCQKYQPQHGYQFVIDKIKHICHNVLENKLDSKIGLVEIYDLTSKQCDTGYYDSSIMIISELSCVH